MTAAPLSFQLAASVSRVFECCRRLSTVRRAGPSSSRRRDFLLGRAVPRLGRQGEGEGRGDHLVRIIAYGMVTTVVW